MPRLCLHRSSSASVTESARGSLASRIGFQPATTGCRSFGRAPLPLDSWSHFRCSFAGAVITAHPLAGPLWHATCLAPRRSRLPQETKCGSCTHRPRLHSARMRGIAQLAETMQVPRLCCKNHSPGQRELEDACSLSAGGQQPAAWLSPESWLSHADGHATAIHQHACVCTAADNLCGLSCNSHSARKATTNHFHCQARGAGCSTSTRGVVRQRLCGVVSDPMKCKLVFCDHIPSL